MILDQNKKQNKFKKERKQNKKKLVNRKRKKLEIYKIIFIHSDD